MGKICVFLSFLCSFESYAQVSGTVINATNHKDIPYVNIWVINQSTGTTSNQTGQFHLNASKTDSVVFSALGFKRKIIAIENLQNLSVELEPQVVQLNEFQVLSREHQAVLEVDKFEKKGFSHYFACGEKPWIIAKYFEYDSAYADTPFLKKLKFLTKSDVKNSQFNIRLYQVNPDGSPGNFAHHGNLLATAKKGKKMTEVDISLLGIRFPENGLFVAIEWLIIPKNECINTYPLEDSKESWSRTNYEPAFGAEQTSVNDNSWKYHKGKWENVSHTSNSNDNKRYSTIAIQLTLSN